MTVEPSTNEAITLKILLIGDSGVGKSSILSRFISDQFLGEDMQEATIGVDFKVKNMNSGNRKVKLTIWDTAGQERFRTLTTSYYRGAHGVILVYDVTNKSTFQSLDTWYHEQSNFVTNENAIRMIVGNKIDKESERSVIREEGVEYAKEKQALFVECSAKSSVGVEDCFNEMVQKILDTPSLFSSEKKEGINLATDNYSYISNCGC
ncbi:small rab-related GTPase [Rozella allomycis CSF55]|uniref:Small rab-related GTPase n=1 Tax=Rozella allomycis (strain CSF55) TaxID=988480 RepID=A0A4P9YNK0_ROZAC|nr:small rab-related GTPase [Rozella allomycis CSF55]